MSAREPLGKHSLLSQTQQIYEEAGVRERARKDRGARGKEEEDGEGGFHSVVICSSCFHTGGDSDFPLRCLGSSGPVGHS